MGGGVERLARFVENSMRVEEIGGREGFYDLNSTCALISPRIIFPIFIFRILSIADIPSGDKAGCLDGDAGNIRLLLRNKMQIILYKLKYVLCLSSIGYEDTELKL